MTNEKNEIEKLDLKSMSLADEKQNQLLRLFPEIRTENGKIDFEKLKLTLGENVDVGKERYGMNWPGKSGCFTTIQTPSLGTLLPKANESVNFEKSENLIIEGDNLEVLKIMQKSYLGKIKVIYLDPPYNTGKDFIYPDNFTESLQTYLEYTGQVDSQGKKFGSNTETDGRFHSKWMNMMWPRLYLARNLLTQDGIILISIDESEVNNLKKICDEIYGEENFAGEIILKNSSKNDEAYVSIQHEYVLFYVKDKNSNLGHWREQKEGLPQIYKAFEGFRKSRGNDWEQIHKDALEWYNQFPEANPITASRHYNWMDDNGVYFADNISKPANGYYYDIIHPITKAPCKKPSGGWRFVQETMERKIKNNEIHFGKDHTTVPNNKTYLKNTESQSFGSVKFKDGRVASNLLYNLMEEECFTNPKDPEFLGQIFKAIGLENGDYVLDFFAGSGSTGQAVLDLNLKDGLSRKFILVQLPERIEHKIYSTIADITKERIRRVIKKIKGENSQISMIGNNSIDLGFKVFKLAESNFKTWEQHSSSEQLESQLDLHIDHVKNNRTAEDILFEILMKSGFPIATKIEIQNFSKQIVYSIAGGMLLICLEESLSLDLIKYIADQKPERVICLDQGFANNDQLKANTVQIFRIKGITSFKTV